MSTSGEQAAGRTFQAGGTLREGALYVERAADQELLQALLRHEYCYVLAPRQIGKSSLRVRACQRLRERGALPVSIDLTTIGSRNSLATEWYYGLLREIAEQLDLPEPDVFWRRHEKLSPVHRFSLYLRDEVLRRVEAPVVVFIDEIDAVLSLQNVSRDDFFAAVRAVYNKRAEDRTYERLTFCLIGVAMPSDLVQDETRTPFNIGRGVNLQDFTREEAAAFLPALQEHFDDAPALLEDIYAWTNGHPYMTQTICQTLVEAPPVQLLGGALSASSSDSARRGMDRVYQVVSQVFLRKGRVLEPNLAYAEKWFLGSSDDGHDSRSTLDGGGRGVGRDARTAAMLMLYGRLRSGERVPADGHDQTQMALRLTGMAVERREPDGVFLQVRNRIFAQVFDGAWVRDLMAKRLIAAPLGRWLDSARRPEFLLQGAALREAQDWAKGTKDLTREECEFLEAAEAVEERGRSQQLNTLFLTAIFKSFANYLLLFMLQDYLVKTRHLPPAQAQQLTDWFFVFTYVPSVLGGPVSDLWLGHRRSVVVALSMMALGYFILSIDRIEMVYVALGLLCLGSGLYKPSFTALVGNIYPQDDVRQDLAFLRYYLGLNIGAALAPLAVTTLLSGITAAFAASGVAIIMGLVWFQRYPETEREQRSMSWQTPRPGEGIRAAALLSAQALERQHLRMLVFLMVVVAVPFWLAFYQSGDTANRWLERHNSPIDLLFDPSSRKQVSRAVNPLFAVALAPLIEALIRLLRRRGQEPGTPIKLAAGMVLTAASLFVMGAGGPSHTGTGFLVAYIVLTLAELLLTSISYSMVVRLSPRRYLATAMGCWFLVMSMASKASESMRDWWQHHGLSLSSYVYVLAVLSLLAAAALMVQMKRLYRATGGR